MIQTNIISDPPEIQEQTELVQQLKDSRAVAAERGVVDEDPSQVSFWAGALNQ